MVPADVVEPEEDPADIPAGKLVMPQESQSELVSFVGLVPPDPAVDQAECEVAERNHDEPSPQERVSGFHVFLFPVSIG